MTQRSGYERSRSAEPSGRRRGRPRDPALHAAIQAAVLRLLGETGYAGLTMDEVAVTAGVSKASIYRRWPTKADLLVDVIETASDDVLIEGDTGSLRGDLIAHLRALARILAGPGGQASRALLGAINDEPALGEAYRRGPLARWSAAFAAAFERAVARGDVAPGAGTSLAAEAGPGIFVTRWIIGNRPLDDALAAAVVDEVMLPLLQR